MATYRENIRGWQKPRRTVPKLAYKELGFKPEMTIEAARQVAKQLNLQTNEQTQAGQYGEKSGASQACRLRLPSEILGDEI